MKLVDLSISEYALRLQRHDWLYEYSDDFRAYKSGRLVEGYLRELARYNSDLADLFLFKVKRERVRGTTAPVLVMHRGGEA